jgi:putative restriction endonuclease
MKRREIAQALGYSDDSMIGNICGYNGSGIDEVNQREVHKENLFNRGYVEISNTRDYRITQAGEEALREIESREDNNWSFGGGTGSMPTAAPISPPDADRYVTAFRAVTGLTDRDFQLLRLHYHAPERTVTARQLAELAGYNSYSVANAQYSRLARLIGQQLDYNPEPERLGTLVTFDKRHGEWHWVMRPQVAQALDSLGWVDGAGVLLPEEFAAATEPVVEGAQSRVVVSAYERDPEARRRCIAAHGTACCVCGFSFGAVYGEVAEGFTHVHHLRPLSEVGGAHVVDPVADLRPVCPNCHAVLHRRVPAYSIEDVREFLAQQRHAVPGSAPDPGRM